MKAQQHGFTIIEMVIYIGIFSIMMSGAVVSVYALAGSAARNQTKAMVLEEGSFLLGKIDWALSGTQIIAAPAIIAPAISGSGNILTVLRNDAATSPVMISVSGGSMSITVGTGPTHVLNNSNVSITCPPSGCFSHTSASADGINPENATSSFTITTRTSQGAPFSQFFSTVKYLRK